MFLMERVAFALLCSAVLSSAAVTKLEVLSRKQLDEKTKYMSSAGLLVVFDKRGKAANRSALDEMIQRSKQDMRLFIIKVVKFDCVKEPKDKSCQFSGEQNLVLWVNWQSTATPLPMDLIDSGDSLVAHCLMVLTGQYSTVLTSQEQLEELVQSAEEREQFAVLGYFERFGSQEHKSFMTVMMTVLERAHVGYTNRTELDFLDSASNKGVTAKVVVIVQGDEDDPRHVFTYADIIKEVELNKFVQIFTLPLLHKLISFEVDDPYSLFGLHLACALMLPDQFAEHKPMIERLARRFRDTFGFVYVDMNKFGKRYRKFGLDSPKKYPVLSIKVHGELERFEFIEDPESFTESFLIAFLNSTKTVYQEARMSKDVLILTQDNYRNVIYFSGKDVIVAFCHDHFEACNLQFHATWRRLGRGVHVAGYSDKLIVGFVSMSPASKPLEDDIADFPDIRFKYGNGEEFIGYQHNGKTPQRKLKPLLRFLAEVGYPDIAVMKKRESDDVPIVPPEDTKHVEYPDEFKPNLFNLDRRDSGESLAIHQRAEHEVDDLLEELNKEKEGRHRPNDKMVGETAPVNREREFHESEVPQDEEEDREDDELAGSVFYLTYKRKSEWKEETIALTDKTIEEKRTECGVLVVHFLSPWAAKSKALTSVIKEAAAGFSSHPSLMSTVCFTHLDCTAYPEVCDRFNVYLYPTVIIFRGDEVHTYKGSLDTASLTQAVQLFQFDVVIELDTDQDLETFVTVAYPPFVLTQEFSLIGFFKSKDSKAYKEYEAVAVDGRGTFPHVACFGDIAKTWSKNFNVDIPAIAALRRGKYMLSETDTFQKTAKTAFDKGNISQFISKSQLSVIELTPITFPRFYAAGLPLAIAFVYSESFYYEHQMSDDEVLEPQERVFSKALADAAKDPKLNSKLLFCWMDVNEYGNLLGFYSSNGFVPTMVIVDRDKGDVYMMTDNRPKAAVDVLKWINKYLDGELKPIRKLKSAEWNPAKPPIDFLAKIDDREAAKHQGKPIDRGGASRLREVPKARPSSEDIVYGETGFESERLHDEL